MWLEVGLCVIALLAYIYYEVTKQFNFFKDRGIPFDKPSFPFGSKGSKQMFMGKVPFVNVVSETLKGGLEKEKIVGFFSLGQPIFIINDQELAKHILVKDFEYFMDRRAFLTNEKYNNNFMTNLTGNEWKKVRALMTRVFTSGKLKMMSKHIIKVGQNLEEHISQIAEAGQEVDMKDVGGKMTLDSIATSMFGIETDSFKDPENMFRIMALTLVRAPGYGSQTFMLKLFFILIFPKAAKFLDIQLVEPKVLNFFIDIIKKTYHHRLETGESRNDLIDVIAEEMKVFKNKEDSDEQCFESQFEKDAKLDTSNIDVSEFDSETVLISNALLFFFAGFDTSSMAFALCCHRLAMHPCLQEKVSEEIDELIGNGPITYDKINNLVYMDKFMSESFRNPTMLDGTERLCTKDYKIPGTDYIIPKGRYVNVHFGNIFNSKDNFANPDEFDPENFDPENHPNKFGSHTFGHGPRSCIGMRYAMMKLKIALISILRHHKLMTCSKTPDTLVMDIKNPTAFKDPVIVKLERRG